MDLNISDLVESGGGIAVGIAATLKWITARFARLERENRESQDELRKQHEVSQAACRADNAALVMRLEKIEDRSHTENRDERSVMLKTLQLNAQAFSKLAEHLEATTPPGGTSRIDPAPQPLKGLP